MTKLDGSQVSEGCPLGYLLLYVRCKSDMSGAHLGSLLYGDVSVMFEQIKI